IRQRRWRNGPRNDGLAATVSARAFIRAVPPPSGGTHDGTRPHRRNAGLRPRPASPTAATAWVGAMLYRGGSPGTSGRPSSSATAFGLVERLNRPPIGLVTRVRGRLLHSTPPPASSSWPCRTTTVARTNPPWLDFLPSVSSRPDWPDADRR